MISSDSSRVQSSKSGELWSTIHRVVHVSLDLPKSTFFDRLYFDPYGVLALEIFTRARVSPSLASAHRNRGRGYL